MVVGWSLQVPLMDIAGRRLLLIIPMILMIVDLVAMTIFLALQVKPTRHAQVTSFTWGNHSSHSGALGARARLGAYSVT